MKKYALLVGINYIGTESQLNGCINDVLNVKDILISKYQYLEENIKVITDLTDIKPTKEIIMSEMLRLTTLTDAGTVWIHFSGHGSYMHDYNGDESDKKDECICPIDYSTAGFITDDSISKIMMQFKETVKCRIIFDSCHSGTALDLPCLYNIETNKFAKQNNNKFKAKILFISGCKDAQTSADAYINSQSQGALTASLLNTLKNANYNISFRHLLIKMRKYLLEGGYDQVPQMSTSNQNMNMDGIF